MNKINIFGMYIGHCVKYKGSAVKVTETMTGLHYEMGHIENGKLTQKVFVICSQNLRYPINLSDCQLILKPISEMSDEDTKEFKRKFLVFPDEYMGYAVNQFLWLIEHGYALSDEWFENGIAVKERWLGK